MENRTPPIKSFLKPSDASAYFQVPLGTVYTWYQLGQIDGMNLGGKCLRIYTKSLVEFLQSRGEKRGKYRTD